MTGFRALRHISAIGLADYSHRGQCLRGFRLRVGGRGLAYQVPPIAQVDGVVASLVKQNPDAVGNRMRPRQPRAVQLPQRVGIEGQVHLRCRGELYEHHVQRTGWYRVGVSLGRRPLHGTSGRTVLGIQDDSRRENDPNQDLAAAYLH